MAKDTFNLNEWVGNKERRLLKEDYEELTPEEMANQNAGSPMHRPEGLEEESREGKDLDKLKVGEKFTFDGKTYTFIELLPDHENTARVIDSEGIERRITFGGGRVNTGEVSGTGVADMGLGKGHHIDEETDQEKLQRTFDNDPNYHEEIDTGGYIENMNPPVLNAAIDEIVEVWEEWKNGPATETYEIPIAHKALIKYIEHKLDLDRK